ncbi:P2Y purinoceptor 6 [Pempheris klunzingeri]|uniref:P2Y purinoceptor 6 n=1 Tax=Pempheris klunzingeri TaxID=3127111 RepID=UPI003980F827
MIHLSSFAGDSVMMGNHSSGSAPLSVNDGNISSNASLGGGPPPFDLPAENDDGLFWQLFSSTASFTEMMNHCSSESRGKGWLGVTVVLLVTAFPANVGLMWLLLNGRRAMTPSEVLGLNVSVMGVLYGLCLPLDVYAALHDISETNRRFRQALFALNMFGLPLLQTCMCLERCVAAARPVAYIRLGRWENRVALCVCAWTLTLAVATLRYFIGEFAMTLPLSATISLLFLVMLLCLLEISWVLGQSGPGEASGSSVPLKRRALKNILAVMVPSVVAYSPLVALVPYLVVILSDHTGTISPEECNVLQLLLLFPNFGLFIGPTFYLSRVRQAACCSTARLNPNSKTQAE